MSKGNGKPKAIGGVKPTFNQKGKAPAGRGGFVPGMRGAPKSGAKQKGFSK